MRITLTLIFFCYILHCFLSFSTHYSTIVAAEESSSDYMESEINGLADSNTTQSRSSEDSFAGMLDRALEKEFLENEQNEANDSGSFNNSVSEEKGKLYLLLLGATALSLVTTPLLFKLIRAVVHLGVLLRWFPPDSPAVEIGYKGDSFRPDSAKHIASMVRDDHDS